MRGKHFLLTLLLLLGFSVSNVVAATIEPSVTDPATGAPEFLYKIKNAQNLYVTGTTDDTNNAANAGLFAFYRVDDLSNTYYIYSQSESKWLSYTKAGSYDNCHNFLTTTAEKTEGAYFYVENYSGDFFQIRPYTTDGVADNYLNWYQGGDYCTTLGLWQQGGADDNGSRWTLTLLESGVEPVLGECYETHLQDLSGTYTAGRYFTSLNLPGNTNGGITMSAKKQYQSFVGWDQGFSLQTSGEEITPEIQWVGQWMHKYVYLDYGNDGQFDVTVSDDGALATRTDVATFNYYKGVNSKGESESNNIGQKGVPSFSLPTEAGFYRMRFKIDWNDINPASTNSEFTANGGQYVDVRLHVRGATSNISAVGNGCAVQLNGGGALPATITNGENCTIKVTPEAGYAILNMKVRYGYKLDGLEAPFLKDMPYWKEIEVSASEFVDGTYTLSGEMTKYDVKVSVTCSEPQKTWCPVKRAASLEPGKNYMLFNAGTVNYGDWTGFVYSNGGSLAVDRSKKPSEMSATSVGYLWTVTQDATGYKLVSQEDGAVVNAVGNRVDEYMAITQYDQNAHKCGDDVFVLLEDETTLLVGSQTTAEHKVFAINNTLDSWGWAVNENGMIYRGDGFFPFAFYEVQEFASESDYASYQQVKDALDAPQNIVGLSKVPSAYEALQSAFETFESDGDIAVLRAAKTTFDAAESLGITSGKAYVFTSVHKALSDAYVNSTADDIEYVEKGTSEAKDLPVSARFICRDMGDGKYAFVNNYGNFLILKGTSSYTHPVTNAQKGSSPTYAEGYCDVKVVVETGTGAAAGRFKFVFKRTEDMYSAMIRTNSSGASTFNQNGDSDINNTTSLFNDSHSTAFVIEEVSYPNVVKLNASGIEGVGNLGTFSAPFATEIPAGVTAYYGASTGDDYVSLTAIKGSVIPANEGVVLESAAETSVTMVPAIEAGAAIENKLANTAGQAKTDIGANDYVLAADKNDGNKAAFCKLASGTVAMNKAYLVMSGASAVKLVFGGTATGIEDAVEADDAAAPVYDLAGRKVSAPVKGGIYVKNGKKFIF